MGNARRTLLDRGMILLGIGLLSAVTALHLFDPPPLQGMRLAVFDSFQRLSPRPYQPVPVRILAIDDASLARLGQWPWPRSLLARLIIRLKMLGAAAIIFDLVLAERDRTSPMEYLRHLPEEEFPPQLIAHFKTLQDNDESLARAMSGIPIVLGFPGATRPQPRRPRLLAGIAHAGSDPRCCVPRLPGAILNLALFEQVAAGQGSFGLGASEAPRVRRVPLLLNIGDTLYPALGIEALRVAQGASTLLVRASDASGELTIGDTLALQSIRVGTLQIPVTEDGHLWLHFTGPVPARTLSVSTALEGPPEAIRNLVEGHILLIGSTAEGLKDNRETPLQPFQAGVEIHAQAIEQMILGWYLQRPDWAAGAETLLLLLIGTLLILLLPRVGAYWCTLIGLLAAPASFAGSWLAFSEFRLLLDPLYPSVAALLVYLIVSSVGYLRTEREKRFLRRAFSTYLAPPLVDRLATSPRALRLGGEAREMTFLITDLAGFTTFTEGSSPERLVAVLNDYLDRMCEIVMQHGGTIDKLVGDAVHAIFNAPLDQPDHAARAVSCALELERAGKQFARQHSTPTLPFGHTRIGVNTGTAVVGNFGGHHRFDYTAYGDAINTAARLESVNKHLGTQVCIAGTTIRQVPGGRFRQVGILVLKGKTQGVEAFTPVPDHGVDPELIAGYEHFYSQLCSGDTLTGESLTELARRFPEDPLVRLHAARLTRGETGPRIVLTEK